MGQPVIERFAVNPRMFEAACNALDIEKKVMLFVTDKPPEGAVEGVQDGTPPEVREIIERQEFTGLYSPMGRSDNDPVEVHYIWVDNTKTTIEVNVALLHELVHASQCERYSTIRDFGEMQFGEVEKFGYDAAPFELEAEMMARNILTTQGFMPLFVP